MRDRKIIKNMFFEYGSLVSPISVFKWGAIIFFLYTILDIFINLMFNDWLLLDLQNEGYFKQIGIYGKVIFEDQLLIIAYIFLMSVCIKLFTKFFSKGKVYLFRNIFFWLLFFSGIIGIVLIPYSIFIFHNAITYEAYNIHGALVGFVYLLILLILMGYSYKDTVFKKIMFSLFVTIMSVINFYLIDLLASIISGFPK